MVLFFLDFNKIYCTYFCKCTKKSDNRLSFKNIFCSLYNLEKIDRIK